MTNASRGSVAPESVSFSIKFGLDFEPGEAGSLKPHGQLPTRESSSRSMAEAAAGRPSTGAAAGAFSRRGVFVSQQQPDAGFVTQQQPLRNISAARAWPVEAEAPPDTHTVPMTAMKAAQKTRRWREVVMSVPASKRLVQSIDYTRVPPDRQSRPMNRATGRRAGKTGDPREIDSTRTVLPTDTETGLI